MQVALPSSPDNAGVSTVARPFPRAEEVNHEPVGCQNAIESISPDQRGSGAS